MKLKLNKRLAAICLVVATFVCTVAAGITLFSVNFNDARALVNSGTAGRWEQVVNDSLANKGATPQTFTLYEDWNAGGGDFGSSAGNSAFLNGALNVPSGTNIIIELNGHNIDRQRTSATGSGHVISVANNATLTIQDSTTSKWNDTEPTLYKVASDSTTYKYDYSITLPEDGNYLEAITCQKVSYTDVKNIEETLYKANGSAWTYTVKENGVTVTKEYKRKGKGITTYKAGQIRGGWTNSYAQGGGIQVYGGNLIIKSGIICDNKNTAGNGTGGVQINTGVCVMTGGVIMDNKTDCPGGGGLRVFSGGGRFEMLGGLIMNNQNATDSGGGVDITGGAYFTMLGGSIVWNIALSGTGGGAYMNDGWFTMGGTSVIKNNHDTNWELYDLNLYMDKRDNGRGVMQMKPFKDGAEIWMFVLDKHLSKNADQPGTRVTKGFASANSASKKPKAYFFCDNGYKACPDKDIPYIKDPINELVFVEKIPQTPVTMPFFEKAKESDDVTLSADKRTATLNSNVKEIKVTDYIGITPSFNEKEIKFSQGKVTIIRSESSVKPIVITFTLDELDDPDMPYYWSDDPDKKDTAPRTLTINIKPHEIDAPIISKGANASAGMKINGLTASTPYSGKEQFINITSPDYDKMTFTPLENKNKRKGTYNATNHTFSATGMETFQLAVTLSEGYGWKSGSGADSQGRLIITLDIGQVTVEVPKLKYNGNDQDSLEISVTKTGGFIEVEVVSADLDKMTITSNNPDKVSYSGGKFSGNTAGNYTLTVRLNDSGYKWSDNTGNGNKTITFKINEAQAGKVAKPTLSKGTGAGGLTLTDGNTTATGDYTKGEQHLTVQNYDSSKVTLTLSAPGNGDGHFRGTDFYATKVGHYTLTVDLANGYEWEGGGNAPYKLTLNIEKVSVTVPTLTRGDSTINITGLNATAPLTSSRKVTLSTTADFNVGRPTGGSYSSGSFTAPAAVDTYSLPISLADSTNYIWSDKDDSQTRYITITVGKTGVPVPSWTTEDPSIDLNLSDSAVWTASREYNGDAKYIQATADNLNLYRFTSLTDGSGWNNTTKRMAPTAIGSYTLKVEIADTSRYVWDDNGAAVRTMTYTITDNVNVKVEVPYLIPTASFTAGGGSITGTARLNASSKFTGQTQHLTLSTVKDIEVASKSSNNITVNGTDVFAEFAGNYTITLRLPANVAGKKYYSWADGTTGTKTISFNIAKRKITVPELATGRDFNTSDTYSISGLSASSVFSGRDQHITISYFDAAYSAFGEHTVGSTLNLNAAGGDFYASKANVYTVNLRLLYPDNTEWTTGGNAQKTLSFEISKKRIDIPSFSATSLQLSKTVDYNKERQYFAISNYNTAYVGFDTPTAGSGVDSSNRFHAQNAGTYTMNFRLLDKDNYEWTTGGNNENTLTLNINKITVNVPTLSNNGDSSITISASNPLTASARYNGNQRSVKVSSVTNINFGNPAPSGASFNETTGLLTARDAGTYTVTMSLPDTDNYTWRTSSGAEDTSIKVITFAIDKIIVNLPHLQSVTSGININDFALYAASVYTGSAQQIKLTNTANINFTPSGGSFNNSTGVFTATDAGEYNITVSLADKTNYQWNTYDTYDRVVTFDIWKKTVYIPTLLSGTGAESAVINGLTATNGFVPGTDGNGVNQNLILNTSSPLSDFSFNTTGLGNGASFSNWTLTAKKAGVYTVVISLRDTNNLVWENGENGSLTLSFTIAQKVVNVPEIIKGQGAANARIEKTDNGFKVTSAYNMSEQYLILSSIDGIKFGNPTNGAVFETSSLHARNVNTYTLTMSLPNSTDYVWSDGTTAQTLTLTFEITMVLVDVPTLSASTGAGGAFITGLNAESTYTGNPQYLNLSTVENIVLNNITDGLLFDQVNKNSFYAIDANTYKITLSLPDTVGYRWNDAGQSTADKNVTFIINPKQIATPTLSPSGEVTYSADKDQYIYMSSTEGFTPNPQGALIINGAEIQIPKDTAVNETGYEIKLVLDKNYAWSYTDFSGSLYIKVNKLVIDVPFLSPDSGAYSENEQYTTLSSWVGVDINDVGIENGWTFDRVTKIITVPGKADFGPHTVVIKPTENYKWNDATNPTGPQTLTFTVNEAGTVSLPRLTPGSIQYSSAVQYVNVSAVANIDFVCPAGLTLDSANRRITVSGGLGVNDYPITVRPASGYRWSDSSLEKDQTLTLEITPHIIAAPPKLSPDTILRSTSQIPVTLSFTEGLTITPPAGWSRNGDTITVPTTAVAGTHKIAFRPTTNYCWSADAIKDKGITVYGTLEVDFIILENSLQNRWNAAVKNSLANPGVTEIFRLDEDWLAESGSFGTGIGFDNGSIYVPVGADIAIILNQYNINRGNTGGNVITVNGKLAIRKDENSDGSGSITGGTAGGVKINGGGTFILEAGSITGNTSTGNGGGVYVSAGATFEMKDSSYTHGNTTERKQSRITGNTVAANSNGGGVYVERGGTFNISGWVDISGNKAGDTAANNVYLLNRCINVVGALNINSRIGVKASASLPFNVTDGFTLNGAVGEDDAGKNTDAINKLVCIVSDDGNTGKIVYNGEVRFVSIRKKPVLTKNEFTYNGNYVDIAQYFDMFDANAMSISGDTYQVNVKADGYKVVIAIKEAYKGMFVWENGSSYSDQANIELAWKIVKADLSLDFVYDGTLMYGATSNAPSVTGYDKAVMGGTARWSLDTAADDVLTITEADGKITGNRVGSVVVVLSITGMSNYNDVTYKKSVTIARAPLDNFPVIGSGVYSTSAQQVPISFDASGKVNVFGLSYTWPDNGAWSVSTVGSTGAEKTVINVPAGVNAGEYIIKIAPDENHCWKNNGGVGEREYILKIARAKLSVPELSTDALSWSPTAQTFKVLIGTQNAYGVGIKIDGYSWTVSDGFTVNVPGEATAKTYTVVITPDSNHCWSNNVIAAKTLSFTIKKAEIDAPKLTKTDSDTSYISETYTTGSIKFKINPVQYFDVILPTGWSLKDGIVTTKNGESAIAHTITLVIDSNHSWKESFDGKLTFTITKAGIELPTVSFVNYPDTATCLIYSDSEQQLLLSTLEGIGDVGLPSGWDRSGTAIFVAPKANAADYDITFTPDGNHFFVDADGNEITDESKWKVTVKIDRAELSLPTFQPSDTLSYSPDTQTVYFSSVNGISNIALPTGTGWAIDGRKVTVPAGLAVTAENADGYAFTLTVDGNHYWKDNQNAAEQTVYLKITATAITVNFSYGDIVYGTDSGEPTPINVPDGATVTWSIEGVVGSASIDATSGIIKFTNPDSDKAGTVKVTMTVTLDNYKFIPAVNTVTIQKAELTELNIENSDTVYGINPALTATGNAGNGTEVWTLSSAYDAYAFIPGGTNILYTKRAGTVTVSLEVRESANYLGKTITKDITIAKADFGSETDGASLTILDADLIYDNTAKTPSYSFLFTDWSGTFEISPDDYETPTWTNNVNAGTATLTIKAKGTSVKFTGTISVDFTIGKQAVDKPTVPDGTYIYTGPGNSVTMTPNGFIDDLMKIEGNEKENVGDYTATVTLKSPENYYWKGEDESVASIELLWSITAAEVTITLKYDKKLVYSGESATPTVLVTKDNVKLPLSEYGGITITSWKVSDTSIATIDENGVLTPVHAGAVTVELYLSSTNYDLPDNSIVSVSVVVEKFIFDVSGWTWDNSAFEYDGTWREVKLFEDRLPAAITVKYYEGNRELGAGEYTAFVYFSYDEENYAIPEDYSFEHDWKIDKKALTAGYIDWTLNGSEWNIGDIDFPVGTMPSIGASFMFGEETYELDVTFTKETGEDDGKWSSGSYKVTVSLKDGEEAENFVFPESVFRNFRITGGGAVSPGNDDNPGSGFNWWWYILIAAGILVLIGILIIIILAVRRKPQDVRYVDDDGFDEAGFYEPLN